MELLAFSALFVISTVKPWQFDTQLLKCQNKTSLLLCAKLADRVARVVSSLPLLSVSTARRTLLLRDK